MIKKWSGLWNAIEESSHQNQCREEKGGNNPLKGYYKDLCDKANGLVQHVSGENFYDVLPQLMEIDAKLRVLNFFLSNEEIIAEYEGEELIALVKAEYKKTHFDRLANFEIKPFEKDSVLFQIN